MWFSPVEAWADAFRSSPDLTGVVSVYEDLRRKGLEFPMTELNGYSTGQPPQKVQTWLLHSLLISGCYLSSLVTSLSGRFCAFAYQTLPANGPAVTTLPAVLLSSKLIPHQTSELKLALEGPNALTPSQVMVWLFPCLLKCCLTSPFCIYVYQLLLASSTYEINMCVCKE